jgi:hypothetical protein
MFDYMLTLYPSLQLNIGIIAACAPSLKPLIGNVLKLSSYNMYNDPNIYENRSKRTTKYGQGTLQQGTLAGKDDGSNIDIELQDQYLTSGEASYHASIKGLDKGAPAKVYGAGGNGGEFGSEETILHDRNSKGIIRTTEIRVKA